MFGDRAHGDRARRDLPAMPQALWLGAPATVPDHTQRRRAGETTLNVSGRIELRIASSHLSDFLIDGTYGLPKESWMGIWTVIFRGADI
jgi:hypothetical protein